MAKKVSKARAKRELEAREWAAKKEWDPHDSLYAEQRIIFDDTSRDRAVCGTRQFGKTTLAGTELIDPCIKQSRSESIFASITIDHGIEVLFPELERLLATYRIKAKLRDDHVAFDNGSVLHCMGLANVSEARKLQGHRPAIVVLDEATDLAANLDEAIAFIKPSLVRHGGRLLVMGIPGPVLAGIWYEICEGSQRAFYSQHRVSLLSNPFIPDAPGEVAREALRLGEDNPLFRRHWRGEWVYDPEATVYRYDSARNGINREDLPSRFKYYVAGLDPAGVADREALVLLGFGNGDGVIYQVDEDVSEPGGVSDYRETGKRVGEWHEKHRLVRVFYDYGSAKKALQLFYRNDQYLNAEPVPVKDLEIEIPRINTLLRSNKLKILRGSKLERDLQVTRWDDKARSLGRNKYSSDNHPDVADALRAALQAVGAVEPEPTAVAPSADELERAEVLALFEKKKSYRPTERGTSPYTRRGRT